LPAKIIKPGKNKNASPKTAHTESASGGAVVIAKPVATRSNGTHANIYDDAVKEVVALSETDAYARKVDNGPLSEARGKDTWRLHAQLRAVDQMNQNLEKNADGIRSAISAVDGHLHTNTVATTQLVERHGSSIAHAIAACETTVTEAVSKAQSAVNRSVKETTSELQGRVEALTGTVKDSFGKLAKATAGTEENLRSQTHSFSKAVEGLLVNLQNEFSKKIQEFRDESTRQIDKRFNQSDVAFAAVRADQEVVKALLTDIIKDRMGRAEPRTR
jgi:hypothetical protein